jgi:hypothetical protein
MWRLAPLLLVLTVTAPALAQTAKGELDAARALANAGLDMFDHGRWAESLERFESAERLFHAPSHWLYIARTRTKLGKLVAARDAYRKLLEEELAADAPPVFHEDQANGKAELPAVEERIARVTVSVTDSPTGATLEIDGNEATIGATTDVDPGEHLVIVSAPGYQPAEQTITLADGGDESIELVLTPAASDAGGGDTAVEEGDLVSWVPAVAMISVGGIGLALGSITGAMALGKNSELEEACPAREQCLQDNQALEDDGRTLATVSTIGFVVGGFGVAAGVAWLLLWPSDEEEDVVARPFFDGQQLGVSVAF